MTTYRRQDWVRGMEYHTPSRSVIPLKQKRLRAFSSEGVRGDTALLILALVLLLFLCFLLPQMVTVHTSGSSIGKLNAEIRELEITNSQLREKLALDSELSLIRINRLNPHRDEEPEYAMTVRMQVTETAAPGLAAARAD